MDTPEKTGPPTFEDQCARYDELAAVANHLEAQGLFFRNLQTASRKAKSLQGIGMDHDRTVCALVVKARRTARAVRMLGEANLAGDAMALSRVALENAIVLAWIVRGPGSERLDTYCVASAVTHQRLRGIMKEHFPENSDIDTLKPHSDHAASISEEVFDDIHTTWAVFENEKGHPVKTTIKEMFHESNELAEGENSFGYDLPYYEGSAYVHSAPASVETLVRALKPCAVFTLAAEPDDGQLRAMALTIANISLATALQVLDNYCGGPLMKELHEVQIKLGASDT